MPANFEWDEDKRRSNLQKHGFDFADAWQIKALAYEKDRYAQALRDGLGTN
jgi:uncharacterized DUF497 family protein